MVRLVAIPLLMQKKLPEFLAHERGTSVRVDVRRHPKQGEESAQTLYNAPRADIVAWVHKGEAAKFIHYVEKVDVLVVGLKWALEIYVQALKWLSGLYQVSLDW